MAECLCAALYFGMRAGQLVCAPGPGIAATTTRSTVWLTRIDAKAAYVTTQGGSSSGLTLARAPDGPAGPSYVRSVNVQILACLAPSNPPTCCPPPRAPASRPPCRRSRPAGVIQPPPLPRRQVVPVGDLNAFLGAVNGAFHRVLNKRRVGAAARHGLNRHSVVSAAEAMTRGGGRGRG
jgi:hypothetical protein